MVKMGEYVKRYSDPSKAIDSHCNRKIQKQLKENQSVIESLFKVVLLCDKQGIPLHGHRDDDIDWNDEEVHSTQSNQTVLPYCLVGIHPKVARAPKTAAHKNHPKNIVSEEKHAHGIVWHHQSRIQRLKPLNSNQMPNTEF